jgi:membrane protein DedA with SNARE-associated domain/membrane-associated phospholipid phosphatase
VIVVATMKWGWLLGAVALAGYLLARRRAHGRVTLVAGWVAVAAAVAIGVGLIHLPKLEVIIEHAGTALGKWTYLLVGGLAFLETGAFVGLVAPGETAVLVGGLVAGQGRISLIVLIAIVWTCAVAGDVTSYTLGRRLGRDWLLRHGERVKITEERLRHVEGFFERRGGATIFIGRFIGFVRPLAPFVAGASGFPRHRFLPYDILGAGAWSATFCVLGYIFWRSFNTLTKYVSRGLFAFGTVVVVAALLYWLVRLRRDEERRERVRAWLAEREDRPGWRPFVRAAGPLWRRLGRPVAAGTEGVARFSWRRFTPGELGLELTTMLAGLAVGGFAFVLIGDAVTSGGLQGIDSFARRVVGDMRATMAVDAAKDLTWLGSLALVAAVVLATSVWTWMRGRRGEALALLVGLGLSYAAVHISKAAYDRPRPPHPLVETTLSSYPSGHALYSVALVACAIALVRAGAGWVTRIAGVIVAVALVALVCATRVYLGEHWLSDVLGGVALGAAVWCGVGAITVALGHVRHNGARRS